MPKRHEKSGHTKETRPQETQPEEHNPERNEDEKEQRDHKREAELRLRAMYEDAGDPAWDIYAWPANEISGEEAENFCSALISLVTEKRDVGVANPELEDFLRTTDDRIFLGYPSLTSKIPLIRAMKLTSEALRIPEIEQFLGTHFSGNLGYRLGWLDEESEEYIAKEMSNLEPGEMIDTLNMFRSIAASMASDGSGNLEHLERIIERSANSQIPLVRYVAERALARIVRETIQPSRSPFHFKGVVGQGKASEQLDAGQADESKRLARQIYPEHIVFRQGDHFSRIAKDAVATFDFGKTPQAFGTIPERLPEPTTISAVFLESARRVTEKPIRTPGDFSLTLAYIQKEICADSLGQSPDEQAETLAALLARPKEEGRRIAELLTIMRGSERTSPPREETRKNNTALYADFTAHFNKELDFLSYLIQNTLADNHLAGLLQGYEASQREGDYRTAYILATRVLSMLQEMVGGDWPPREISALYHKMEETQTKEQENRDYDSLVAGQITPEEETELVRWMQDLIPDEAAIRRRTQAFLDDLKASQQSRLPTVRFSHYSEIEQDPQLNPFGSKEEGKLTKLLQNIHDPYIQHQIERDFGVDPREMPLQNQIHFLKFIAGKDRSVFDHIARTLEKHPHDKDLILNTFLACREGEEYGEIVLKLADRMDDENLRIVLTAYARVAEASNHVREYLANALKDQQPDREKIAAGARHVARKANELLTQFAKKEGQLTSEEVGMLERASSETILFAAACKIASQEKPLDFNEILHTELLSRESSELSLEQRAHMLSIFKENRSEYADEKLRLGLTDLEHSFEEGGNRFYLVEHKGKLAGFVRFKDLTPGRVYGGSFNVPKLMQGSSIGKALLEATLTIEGKENVIEAKVYAGNPALSQYLKAGFIIVGQQDQNGLMYQIERPRTA